ncbi:MAG TPA: TonB family protein, partial [Polyangiaceae bacterium]
MRPRLTAPSAFATSVVLHALGLGTGAWLLSRSLSGPAPRDVPPPHEVEVTVDTPPAVDLPVMSRQGTSRKADPEARPRPSRVVPGGGERLPRPDQRRAGRGGTRDVAQHALNLADSNDELTLDRDPLNRLDRSQVQRLQTDSERRSLDDRRATPQPMELSFLASGSGRLPERRTPSLAQPANGSFAGALPSLKGGVLGGPVVEPGLGPEAPEGAATEGGDVNRSGQGSPFAAPGSRYQRDAAVALARPWVPQARAAVPAGARGRPHDTLDSSQEVASAVASLIHASSAGGRIAGNGPGGEPGPGRPASGGTLGPGSRSLASGDGPGPARSTGLDPALLGYFRSIVRRVDPYWKDAFPYWAIAEGRGGIAIIGMTLQQDGRVVSLRVVRGSGVMDFDRNLIAALERAGPYGPLPGALGRGPVTVNVSFDALNPIVGRDGPGRGRAARRA